MRTKFAQSLDGIDVPVTDTTDSLDLRMPLEHFEHIVIDEEGDSDRESVLPDDVLISVEESEDGELILTLDKVPGGEDQDDLPELEVEEKEEIQVTDDPWAWKVSTFLPWLSKMMQAVPKHSGRDTAGLERAIAYLEALDREISKAVRGDLKNELDISKCEQAREEIHAGLERLHSRHEKVKVNRYPKARKKKAEETNELVKEGGMAGKITGISITVPLMISIVARTCISSMVSGGRDIEDTFQRLAKKWSLTKREQLETVQLLEDMGYQMYRPRGYDLDEDIYGSDPDLMDTNTRFQA